jgi:hypothetical protein
VTTTSQRVYIEPTDESFFVIERGGWLSQYFMATQPGHILMQLLIDRCMERLLNQTDIYHLYIPAVTGPGALKVAFMHFMNQSWALYENHKNSNASSHLPILYNKVGQDHFVSPQYNTTVTAVGTRRDSDRIVQRDSVTVSKTREYLRMNMTYYHAYMNDVKDQEPVTCRALIIQRNQNVTTSERFQIENDDESWLDQQIEQEIRIGNHDLTKQYFFFDEEIYHLKNHANKKYKMSWLSGVQTMRKT